MHLPHCPLQHRPRLLSRLFPVTVLLLVVVCPCFADEGSLQQRYLDGILLSFDEDPMPALQQLARLHDSDRGAWSMRRTAKRLAAADPEVLVPLIALEVKLHALVIGLDNPAAGGMERAGRTKRVIKLLVKLCDDYLDRSEDSDEAGSIVSQLLTSTAVHYRDPRYREPWKLEHALRFLDKALHFDPRNTAAQHLQACIEEKRGNYVRAARSFERLLELDPSCEEARLRIALCLLRDAKEEPAMPLLEQVASSQGPAWVRSLAWQELAQLHALAGDRQQAMTLVRRGITQLADDECMQHRLQLLLLFLLDDRSSESSDLLAQLSDDRDRQWQASPRVQYNLPPDRLTGMLVQLAQDIQVRLPRLEAALELAEQQEQQQEQEQEETTQ